MLTHSTAIHLFSSHPLSVAVMALASASILFLLVSLLLFLPSRPSLSIEIGCSAPKGYLLAWCRKLSLFASPLQGDLGFPLGTTGVVGPEGSAARGQPARLGPPASGGGLGAGGPPRACGDFSSRILGHPVIPTLESLGTLGSR